MDEDGDELVKVIDVFLSQEASSELHLLQYPLRPTWRPYDRKNIAEVRYKPKSSKLELDVALSEEELSLYFDELAREDLAKKGFTLTGSNVLPQTNYAIGLLRPGPEREQLHLTPIKGVFQMRPSFTHIDAKEEAKKNLAKKEEAAEEDKKQAATEEDGKIRSFFARRETPRQRELRQTSHNFLKQQEQGEPWKKLSYLDEIINYNDARAIYAKLIAKETQDVPFDMPSKLYVENIASNKGYNSSPEPATSTARTSSAMLTLSDILKIPSIDQQIITILSRAHTALFLKLVELLKAQGREDEMAQCLRENAILADDHWVLRSTHLYKGKLCRARDFMLLMFHENGFVTRKKLSEEANISAETARELLLQVAELKHMKQADGRWHLRHERDEYFVSNYPEIAEEHRRYWAENRDRIMQLVQGAFDLEEQGPNTLGDPRQGRANFTPAATAIQDYESRFTSGEVAVQLRHFLSEMFATYGVINMGFLKQRLRDRQEKDTVLNRGTPDQLIRQILGDIAYNIQGVFCAKMLHEPAVDKFRVVVVEMFRTRTSLRKKEVDEACQQQLQEKPPTSIYARIMKELAYSSGGQWIIKKGNGIDA